MYRDVFRQLPPAVIEELDGGRIHRGDGYARLTQSRRGDLVQSLPAAGAIAAIAAASKGLDAPLPLAAFVHDYFRGVDESDLRRGKPTANQRWGNPVYRWDVLREKGYTWWIKRLERNLHLFDIVRIDHFRGFEAYWEIPAEEPTAVRGEWVKGPGDDFFQALVGHFHDLPIVAEDLGTITQGVRDLMDRFRLPGMKLLVFAFSDDLATNPYVPHNHVKNCLIYTGTHDNNTVRGWFETELTEDDKARLTRYLGREVDQERIHEEMVRLAMMSVANTAILPMQDLLGLGEEARMNRPARSDGNWQWQLVPEQLRPELGRELREMTETYGRL